MAVELQLTEAALAASVARALAAQLRTTCLPPLTGASIDHLDVVPGAASVASGPRGVEVHVPVDVFIVTDAALAAAPNAVPAGATAPLARVAVVFVLQLTMADSLAADGSVVTATSMQLVPSVDLSSLGSLPGIDIDDLERKFTALLPTPSADLTGPLAQLGLTRIDLADIQRVAGVVALRFGALPAPTAHLFPGQDWGLYVDGPGVEALLRGKVAAAQAALPGATLDVHWAPSGDTPHVDITLSGHVELGPFGLRLVADMPTDLSLAPGAPARLRATVDWSVHVYAGDLVPGFLEKIGEDLLADAVDPTTFGGTPTGDREFVIDTLLPALPLLGATLRYDSVHASPDGMTLGGAVVLAALAEPPLALQAGPLSGPLRIELCSQRARTGSGAPSRTPPSLTDTISHGSVTITGCGELCEIDVVTPFGFGSYISAPVGVALESATVQVSIPYAVAGNMSAPLVFVVRTPRGVRTVDLGIAPRAELGPNGELLNAHSFYIPDCLNFVPLGDGRSVLGWDGDVDIFKPPPLEHPDWLAWLAQAPGLIVQLVRVGGLQPGEQVRFRSAAHAIDVQADAHGRARVPALLPMVAAPGGARLERAGGRPFDGHVSVRAAYFEHRFTLPGRLEGAPRATPAGHLRLALRSGHGAAVQTVTPIGPATFAGNELNPQPLPPGPPPERLRELAREAGLHGVANVAPVPGFADAGLAVVTLHDGSTLLLDHGEGGAPRIAGTWDGPIGVLESVGAWAVATGRRDTAVLRFSMSGGSRGVG